MIPTFLNNAYASFFLWAENQLLNKAQAYHNYTSKLYYTPDPELDSNYVGYSSPFKQWVCDGGVAGAQIPSGISGSLNLTTGQSGLKFDFTNDRVILNSGVGKRLNISGSYAFKEVNFYIANETEDELLNNSKYYLNSNYGRSPFSGIPPHAFVAPAVFITPLSENNSPFALGGQELTEIYMSMVVFTENSAQLNGVISTYADSVRRSIPVMSASADPLNEFGDIKSIYPTGYNYLQVASTYNQPGNLMLIEDVRGSRLSDRSTSNPELFCGIIQVKLTMPRYPRS